MQQFLVRPSFTGLPASASEQSRRANHVPWLRFRASFCARLWFWQLCQAGLLLSVPIAGFVVLGYVARLVLGGSSGNGP